MVDLIFTIMKERNITAKELSDKTGIKAQTISQWKKGLQQPSTKAIKEIADYFDVSADYLLGREVAYQKLVIPSDLAHVRIATHLGESEDLTQDEINKLAEFAKFLKSQRTQ